MQAPDRLRLPFDFDAALLARDLAKCSADEWTRHFVPRNYEGDWSVLPLRAPTGATHPIMKIYSDPGCRSFEDAPILRACPYFRRVLESFECPLHAVRLMRLGPKSVIKEHRDHDLSFEDGAARIHIPIKTNDQVEFRLNGSRVMMQPGTAWYLRLSEPHSVANNGPTDRVHLVIDAVVDAWLAALFQRASAAGQSRPALAGSG